MNQPIRTLIGAVFVPAIIEPFDKWVDIVPPYLLVFIGILLFLTLITIILRVAVYQYLASVSNRVKRLIHNDSRGTTPKIVQEIERRLQEAIANLDKINTGALIDQVYHQYLSATEWRDYLCRWFPNLLLALGLLGTFVGITINLTELSQTINEFGVGNIDDLVNQVQTPIQGMGVAFVSSLTAVACSALLTVVNLLQNTSVAKAQLISALEDYVDNIYMPGLGYRAPIDRAVDRIETFFDRMSSQVLTGMNDAVESSLGDKVQKITEGNLQANHLATQVYNRFMESANAMKSGATVFRESANIIEGSQFAHKLSGAAENLTNSQKELSVSASILSESTQAMTQAIATIKGSGQEMEQLTKEVNSLNQQSAEVLSLNRSNQESIADIVSQLQQGANIFSSVLRTLDLLQKRLDARADRLINIHAELSKLVDALREHTEDVTVGIQNIGDRLVAAVNQPSSSASKEDPAMSAQIDRLNQDLNAVQSQLAKLVQGLDDKDDKDQN